MKARILNDKFEGIYTDDFIQKNLNNIINNQIVSDWFLTDILPNKNELNYIKLMFDSQNYYEGATPEEIAEAENQNNIELKKQAHDQLSETDWYVTRFIEIGKPIPTEILEQRQLIRNSI